MRSTLAPLGRATGPPGAARARPDGPAERPAITQNGGSRLSTTRTIELAGRGSFQIELAGQTAALAGAPAAHAAPALLLHGLGADSTLWYRVLPLLARERTVYAVDLRGHGDTRAAAGDRSLAAHATDVLALADTLAPGGGGLHLLGTSLGGVIAQIAAAAEPARFVSLVLACTWCAAPPGLDAAALADAIAAAPDIRVHFAGVVRAMLPDHPDDALLLLDAIAAADRTALVQGARELFAYDGRERLAAITAPALVISAERDEMFPHAAAQAIAAGLVDARLGVLAGCGHAPYIERPQLFAGVVGEFWRERDAAPA